MLFHSGYPNLQDMVKKKTGACRLDFARRVWGRTRRDVKPDTLLASETGIPSTVEAQASVQRTDANLGTELLTKQTLCHEAAQFLAATGSP